MTQTNRGGLMLMVYSVWLSIGSTITREGWASIVSFFCMAIGAVCLTWPTPEPKQAVATQAANAEVVEKAGEVAISGPEGNSRA